MEPETPDFPLDEPRQLESPQSGLRGRWNLRPKLRWFVAEIAVVVTGVLIALALNAWWQGQQASASEQHYLVLLSRDLEQLQVDLGELAEIEEGWLQDGLASYRILSSRDHSPANRAIVSERFSRLSTRKTINLTNATYEDLISTGNLQLIHNRSLRDQIVAFYEEAERQFAIHDKNNAFFVDQMLVGQIFGRGLFYHRSGSVIAETPSDSMLAVELANGFVDEPDYIWSLPNDSPEWAIVKGHLLMRINISTYEKGRAEDQLSRARELQIAVDAERSGN